MRPTRHAFLFLVTVSGIIASPARAAASQGVCTLLDASSPRYSQRFAAATSLRRADDLAPVPLPGPHDVKFGHIPFLPGLVNGGKHSAVVVYPAAATAPGNTATFPFLSFAHATFVGGLAPATDEAYYTLMRTVVSLGFIVVAPESCPFKECASNFAKDQLTTIVQCKANRTLHPALKAANFERVGVFGHSMGAMASIGAAGGSVLNVDPAEYGIVAAVSMHPCWDPLEQPRKVKVPIMFTAGDADVVCPDGCAKSFFGDVVETKNKILFNIAGADHFDPTDLGKCREDLAIALFLSCWVKGDRCNDVYGAGAGNAICREVQNGTLANCTVVGNGPPPASLSTSPSPSRNIPIPTVTIAPGPVEMPLVTLGTARGCPPDPTVVKADVALGFQAGLTAFDTAHTDPCYNDTAVGEALKGVDRSTYFLTSKIPSAYVMSMLNETLDQTAAELDGSLANLGVAYVDLMLIHHPGNARGKTLKESVQAQWAAMEAFQRAGKARAIGVSNFCRRALEAVLETATIKPAVNQVLYHAGMGADPDGVVSLAAAHNITIMAFSPTDQGNPLLLSGEPYRSIGAQHNKSALQVALRWLSQRNIPFAMAADKLSYIQEDSDVFDFELTTTEMETISAQRSCKAGNMSVPFCLPYWPGTEDCCNVDGKGGQCAA